MGSRGAECSRLRDGNEYVDVIEIGRFAHAQHSSAALIIALGSRNPEQERIASATWRPWAPRSRVSIGEPLGLYRQCSDASVLGCED